MAFNNYRIVDNVCYIDIAHKGKQYITKVDAEDLPRIKKEFGRMFAKPRITDNYVINRKGMKLHRLITNCPKGLVVDHINHDTLDNRKCNLRIVEQIINANNKRRTNKINIKGVYANHNIWTAELMYNRVRYRKHFSKIEDAIRYRKYLESKFLNVEELEEKSSRVK